MKKFIKELIPYIIIIISVVIIRTFIVTPVRVDGVSMSPTLENNEILILNKVDKSYNRFDVIVFNYNNEKLVKRIIGLPGETIKVKDNKLYINNKYINEEFTHRLTDDYEYERVIPSNTYFVMGDNRSNSLDSRFIGPINKQNIEGTVNISLLPLKKIK